MSLCLLTIVIVNPVTAAAGCASRVAPDSTRRRRTLHHCKLHIPGRAAASPHSSYQGSAKSRTTSPGVSLPPSGRCGRGRHCRTGAACYQDTCAASRLNRSSASGARSWAHVGDDVTCRHAARGSRPQPPGRLHDSPLHEAAAVAPAGRRHRAWREARMQNLFKPVFKLNADAPAPGTTGPRPAERLAYVCCRTGTRG